MSASNKSVCFSCACTYFKWKRISVGINIRVSWFRGGMEPKISKITVLSTDACLCGLCLCCGCSHYRHAYVTSAYIEVKTRSKESTRLEQEQQHYSLDWISMYSIVFWASRLSVLASYANAKLMVSKQKEISIISEIWASGWLTTTEKSTVIVQRILV